MNNIIPGLPQVDPSRIQETSQSNGEGPDFFDTLKNTMGQVEQLGTDAQGQVGKLLSGDGQDIHSAMIAVEKADMAFQLMMQVRNKIISAYQEVSRMTF
jgi:flagellar hook-basal body complex protein FliE